MDWTKFWPTLIPVLGLIVDSLSGVLGPWLATHPTLALVVLTVVTAIANVVKSPRR